MTQDYSEMARLKTIRTDLESLGLPMDDGTILKYLKEGSQFIDTDALTPLDRKPNSVSAWANAAKALAGLARTPPRLFEWRHTLQHISQLPDTGFVRLASILAPRGPIPVSKSTWWAGVTAGSVHDAKVMDNLIREDDRAVSSDKAYACGWKKVAAKKVGLLGAVKEKAQAGRPLTRSQRAFNKKHGSVRAKVEHVFRV